jgi:hypothetical protein
MSTPEFPRFGPQPGQSPADPLPDLPPTAPVPYQSGAPSADQPPTVPPPGYEPPPGQPQYPQGQYPPVQAPYPYPYPAPPGYGQPPYPYSYPYPQPQRRSNRTLWIVLGSVGGVLVLLCAACAVGIGLLSNQIGGFIGPIATASSFCVDEEQADYASAFTLLSTNLQGQYGEAGWEQANRAREVSYGPVQNCAPVSSGLSVAGNAATMRLQLTLNDGTHAGPITLVKEGSQWKIDTIDPGLNLLQQSAYVAARSAT